MAKNGGGGFFDDLFNNPFGGIFDFNGDGKEDFSEQWIGYKIFEEVTKEEKDDDDTFLGGGLGAGFGLYSDDDYSWRDDCIDGIIYDIDPEDYETLEEYNEAVEEAKKHEWRQYAEDGSDVDVDPEDFETEEEYEEALEEARHAWREFAEDGFDVGLDSEDYETEEEYEEALDEARYAWRNNVPDGSEYGLDPCDYASEQEYLNAIQKEKYSWRKWCLRQDTLGLDVNEFETEKEYREAWRERRQEEQNRKRRDAQEQCIAENKQRTAELASDKTIYTYCGVKLPFSDRPYSFRTEDGTVKIGDAVIVPIGEDNKETEGIVVSVGQYARMGVPYPPERTKFIIKKLIKSESEEKTNGQA